MCQRPLQLSQVFTTVIQLLGEAGFSDRLKDDQWQHITKSYAQLMKASNSSINLSDMICVVQNLQVYTVVVLSEAGRFAGDSLNVYSALHFYIHTSGQNLQRSWF